MSRPDPTLVVAVDTPDLERAVRFWRDVLGCEVLQDRSPEFVMVAIGTDAGLCIDRAPAGARPPSAPRLLLAVRDVAAREVEVAEAGVLVHGRGGRGGRPWFSVLDPDGREVIFQTSGGADAGRRDSRDL